MAKDDITTMNKTEQRQVAAAKRKIVFHYKQTEAQLRFATAMENKAIEVAPSKIANRIATFESVTLLQSTLDAIDPEFSHFQQIVCNKTGQVIGNNNAETISNAIQHHGREKALSLLQLQYTTNTAPTWLDTSPVSLTQLAKRDPFAYFVYAAAKCMKLDGPYKSTAEAEKIFQHANNMEKLSLTALVNAVRQNVDLRDQFADAAIEMDKRVPATPTETRAATTERFINVRVRVQMYVNLKKAHADNNMPIALIIEANELMRRLLATSHPRNLPTNSKFWGTPMYATTGELQMAMWVTAIRDEQRRNIREYMKNQLNKNIEIVRNAKPTMSQVMARIANIRVTKGGLASFHEQRALSSAFTTEAALIDIDDLDLFDNSRDELTRELKARASKNVRKNAKRQADNQRFTGRLQHATSTTPCKPAPFKLRLPGAKS